MDENKKIEILKEVCSILDRKNREDLVEGLIEIFQEYSDLREELKEFVNQDISSSEEEMDDEELPELEDEEIIVKVDAKGFHSIK
tara:strand:- start:67 stop:321 length:255 start_codon:yes stop_codon:yes gene_type:complete